jgi:hypothetical protein
MDPEEAAIAAELLGVRYAVASHYYETGDDHVQRFLASVRERDTSGQRVPVALEPNEVLVIDGEVHRIEPFA